MSGFCGKGRDSLFTSQSVNRFQPPATSQSGAATPTSQKDPVDVIQASGWDCHQDASLGEVCRACPPRRPPDRARTHWRDYISQLVWKRLGIFHGVAVGNGRREEGPGPPAEAATPMNWTRISGWEMRQDTTSQFKADSLVVFMQSYNLEIFFLCQTVKKK